MFFSVSRKLTCFLVFAVLFGATSSYAETSDISNTIPHPQNSDTPRQALTSEQRKKLAQSFLARMKPSLNRADSLVNELNLTATSEKNFLPEGEMVMLLPVYPPGIRGEGLIAGTVRNGKILLSLRDFASVLQLPITVEEGAQRASGWYIREIKDFELNMASGYAKTDNGRFNLSKNVISENNDLWVEVRELAKWLDFKMKADVALQELDIESPLPLPFQERYARRKMSFGDNKTPEVSLPRKDEPYQYAEVPFVDVATTSSYRRKNNDSEPFKNHTANIRTTGDLGYGTLTTQSLINSRDQVNSVRAVYKRESDKPELLGALKARKFEVGDVTTARLPVGASSEQELGARITNVDPNRGTLRPTTVISGNAFTGWDVELYRDNQLVAFQEVGDDGIYQFEDVALFANDNKFRVVFYGPQGEMVEETVFVPVDNKSLAKSGGVYDVSLTFNDQQTYIKKRLKNRNTSNGPNLTAFYEKGLGLGTTGSVGFRSNENNVTQKRDHVANAGIATVAFETLFNADGAIDDEAEVLGELSARRSFGNHDVSNTLTWTGAGFDQQSGGNLDESLLENDFNIYGPFPLPIGTNPRYSVGTEYIKTGDGEETYASSAGISTSWKRLTFNQEVQHGIATDDQETIISSTNLSGTYGPNRLRLGADYGIKPDSELKRVLANYRRDITKKLSLDLEWNKNVPQSFSEYTARLDWQAGFIRLSPRISYDSDKEFFAGLNTRFGILREPTSQDIKFFDRTVTSNGGVSAFVYLDKDGNGKFNKSDEPLPDVVVQAPQNGGREKTDASGVALFYKMGETRATDIFVDKESLQDPAWVPGFQGVSVLPRAGHIATVEFPIHVAGEIDGVVALRGPDSLLLKNVTVTLYNAEGNTEQTAVTDPGGFYYFTRVPPGRYLLIVDEKSAKLGNFIRPEPQPIEIGYDGTVMYGNDILVDDGEGDIPSEIKADLEDYKARHPQIDFTQDNYDIVLNLGEYNSNVLMSLIWYKVKMRYAPMVAGGSLFVPPSESFADVKTGKHTLRVGLRNETINGAYSRCRSLMARNQYCKVEIYPAYMKQAKAEEGPEIVLPQ